MEQYRTLLEVRFRDDDGQEAPWQRYDEVMDPYYSYAPRSEHEYVDDSDWLPGSVQELAQDDLREALGIVIDEQYLVRVVRDGPMDVRVRLVEGGSGDTTDDVVAVCTPSPEEEARAYLEAALRGYDDVRDDLRGRLLQAHRAGVDGDKLIGEAAGRIEATEIRGLFEADRLAEAARAVVADWEDPEERTVVSVERDNSVVVLLRTSFRQENNYEDMCRSDGEGYEDCEDGDFWGYKEGVRDAEALLQLLTEHYTVTCGDRPAAASDLAPLDPHQWGRVSIAPKPGAAWAPSTPSP
ncbi:hypothetical protein [Streptomyces sp. VNUA24]|uniref:hypothetical protein n=1 Tax=Streptomyces sp. VNUA24 TaxID=3031131 RepID=UPI0023B86592|nr:hypothetical protein [Streptomyces sp. VNUA24]WEH12233.1 hypothetical protein PYR72_00335 [Streptomyces sp. VNUA24]